MNNIEPAKRCYFSNLETHGVEGRQGFINYRSSVPPKDYIFYINHEFKLQQSKIYNNSRHIFQGMMLNRTWPQNETVIETEKDLVSILSEGIYPRTLKEKLDRLFMTILQAQSHVGQKMEYKQAIGWGSPSKYYFKNEDELHFCFETLDDEGLIEILDRDHKGFNIKISFKGLQYGNDLTEQGKNSSNCFIAMSFGELMRDIRSTIRRSVEICGYTPILIDEVLIAADQTINEAILVNLKMSKFCIADFTEQRDGVYFESGFALGRGIPVIYTCRKDWFERTHFDTNHFPHIVYSDLSELESKLVTRIQAWID